METLLTGHLDVISQPFLTHLSMKSDIILSCEKESLHFSGKNLTFYHQSILDDDFLNLFSSYSFDAVIFFLSRPESRESDPYEIDKLERILEACTQRSIKKMIVVSSSYIYDGQKNNTEKSVIKPSKGVSLRLSSMEELCRTYRETYNVPVTILRTSCLFGEEETSSYIGKTIKQLIKNDELVLDGQPDQVVEFLSITDLGRLIERILLEPQNSISVMNVPGATRLMLRRFAGMLEQQKETAVIDFTGEELTAGPPLENKLASREYHWHPTIKLEEEISTLIEVIEKKHQVKKQTPLHRIRDYYQSHSILLAGIELLIGFLIMEYLVSFSQATVQFRVVDYRLLFVVLFAGAHGPQIGMVAALMASYSTYTSYAALGVDWRIIFYNAENWVPFAAYFIVAWIIGYIHDRYKIDLADAEKEVDMLSNRYSLLNDLYMRSLEHKSLYEKQIISYKDSFGKIYKFTDRLEKAESDSYFNEALKAVEDILDNQTVSIYIAREKSQKAYRYVCSTKAEEIGFTQLDLKMYPEFKKIMIDGGVWKNKHQLEGYPDFAVGLMSSDVSVLITVHEASFDQMSLYFENLIKVTGHFVSSSLTYKLDKENETLKTSINDFLNSASFEKESYHIMRKYPLRAVESAGDFESE